MSTLFFNSILVALIFTTGQIDTEDTTGDEMQYWTSYPDWPQTPLELSQINWLWRGVGKSAEWIWPTDWYENLRFDIGPLITKPDSILHTGDLSWEKVLQFAIKETELANKATKTRSNPKRTVEQASLLYHALNCAKGIDEDEHCPNPCKLQPEIEDVYAIKDTCRSHPIIPSPTGYQDGVDFNLAYNLRHFYYKCQTGFKFDFRLHKCVNE